MPIAKEQLTIGFTVVANPGNYVTQEAVDEYGWKDMVEAGPDPAVVDGVTKDAKAPKGRAQKGS
jgi:hypothetical protein